MFDPHVRPATAADADQLEWLEQRARAALVGARGGDRWLADHPARTGRWQEVIERDLVFVAELDDVCLGYLVGSVDGELAIVEEPFVAEQARENGFGDALLAAFMDASREAGARILDGTALPGDRETKNLYERAGIKARLITVSTEL